MAGSAFAKWGINGCTVHDGSPHKHQAIPVRVLARLGAV
jgi:hypothetical protein